MKKYLISFAIVACTAIIGTYYYVNNTNNQVDLLISNAEALAESENNKSKGPSIDSYCDYHATNLRVAKVKTILIVHRQLIKINK